MHASLSRTFKFGLLDFYIDRFIELSHLAGRAPGSPVTVRIRVYVYMIGI